MKNLLTAASFIACSLSIASIPQYLPADLEYAPEITTPAEFLGYSIGERHLVHAELVAYLKQLDRESDRIQLVEIGQTHGHRPLIQLLISDPDNLKHLEDIRLRHHDLMDPRKAARIPLENVPVVLNLGYGVHGNESSGPNAAPVVAYYLAAAQDAQMRDFLSKTVVVLDPSLNPDGMDRFANWANRYSGKNPSSDPADLEHTEGWPNGRTNYYWFDLNRDWLLLTQPESVARIRQFNRWMPDLLLDFHEMGTNSTYFFQPGVPERNHPLTPESNFLLTKRISGYFAKALDKIGSQYFSQERFDDFYMGKGSTMPDLKGGIGILFEQASSRGLIQDSVNGPVSFPFTIQNQVTISLACLKVASELHDELLENKRSFFKESLQMAKSAGYSGYRFASPGDPARALEFVRVLKEHDIRVEAFSDEDAWFIPLQQPHYRYLESMVEQRTQFRENLFYDITAWTLPLAYNLEFERMQSTPDTGIRTQGVPSLESSPLGYLVDWADMNAPRVLLDLLEEDVITKVARKPLTLNGRDFGYGTLFVPVTLQTDKAERIHEILEKGLQDHQVSVFPVHTFLTEKGIDLGSRDFVRVQVPKILLAAGPGMDAYNTGSIWHLLDQLHDYPVTMVDPSSIGRMDLSKYTSLVLYGYGSNLFPDPVIESIQDWIKEGGTLICLGNSSRWAIEKDLVSLSLVQQEQDKEAQEPRPRRPFAGAMDDRALEQMPGAIFQVDLDPSHPLAYGYSSPELPVFSSGKVFLAPSGNRYQTPLVYNDEPLLAGYVSSRNLELLAGSAAAVVESHGAGTVILFGHNPIFRAYWRGTEKLLLNGMLFGPLMKARDPGAYSD